MTVGQLIAKLAILDQNLPITTVSGYRGIPIMIKDVGTQEGPYYPDAYQDLTEGRYAILFKESK